MTRQNSEKKKPIRYIKKNGRVIPIHERQRKKRQKKRSKNELELSARTGAVAVTGAAFHAAEAKADKFLREGDASIPWTDKGLAKYARRKQDAANSLTKAENNLKAFHKRKIQRQPKEHDFKKQKANQYYGQRNIFNGKVDKTQYVWKKGGQKKYERRLAKFLRQKSDRAEYVQKLKLAKINVSNTKNNYDVFKKTNTKMHKYKGRLSTIGNVIVGFEVLNASYDYYRKKQEHEKNYKAPRIKRGNS